MVRRVAAGQYPYANGPCSRRGRLKARVAGTVRQRPSRRRECRTGPRCRRDTAGTARCGCPTADHSAVLASTCASSAASTLAASIRRPLSPRASGFVLVHCADWVGGGRAAVNLAAPTAARRRPPASRPCERGRAAVAPPPTAPRGGDIAGRRRSAARVRQALGRRRSRALCGAFERAPRRRCIGSLIGAGGRTPGPAPRFGSNRPARAARQPGGRSGGAARHRSGGREIGRPSM